jgi:hypothetical protein
MQFKNTNGFEETKKQPKTERLETSVQRSEKLNSPHKGKQDDKIVTD